MNMTALTQAFVAIGHRSLTSVKSLRTLANSRSALDAIGDGGTRMTRSDKATWDNNWWLAHGVFHLANAGETSWASFAKRAAELANVGTQKLAAVSTNELALRAPRPRYSALTSVRGAVLPPLEDAIARYLRESRVP